MTLLAVRSDRKRVAAAAAAVLSIAVTVGCSDSDAADDAEGNSPTTPVSAAAPTEPSPAFEGIDPCGLVPVEKVTEAAGVPEIAAERSPQSSPEIIGCEWGGYGVGSASLALMVGDDMGTGLEMEHEVIGDAGGKGIELTSGTPGNCTVRVKYGNERTMLVSVTPTAAAQASDTDNPNLKWCDQAVELARTADSNLEWG